MRPAREEFVAEVEERVPAGSYTYYRLNRRGRSVWAVTMGQGPTSRKVRVKAMGQRDSFYSKRLKRTFDSLLFAIIRPLDQEP
jgi:hypothetical protein